MRRHDAAAICWPLRRNVIVATRISLLIGGAATGLFAGAMDAAAQSIATSADSATLPSVDVVAPRARPVQRTTAPVSSPSDSATLNVDSDQALVASASEKNVSGEEVNARPFSRPAEALEVVPGLIVTQHSGDGKANQYFLRGFNLDHGTDLSINVDGMPVNMRTHGHGQGYADLNFLIPELRTSPMKAISPRSAR